MARSRYPSHSHLRESIAQLAARLMAEGIEDFALAKRKAARQLGVSDMQHLPNNSEVEQALRAYQALFGQALNGGEDQQVLLGKLRAQALRIMRELDGFSPLLTGSVLRGTATPYSDINLLLFADSQKDIELYLLNRDLVYKTSEKRLRFGDSARTVPVLRLNFTGEADVHLVILSAADRKCLPLSPVDGRPMQGARLAEVESLLEAQNPQNSKPMRL